MTCRDCKTETLPRKAPKDGRPTMKAHGLCTNCYNRHYAAGTLDLFREVEPYDGGWTLHRLVHRPAGSPKQAERTRRLIAALRTGSQVEPEVEPYDAGPKVPPIGRAQMLEHLVVLQRDLLDQLVAERCAT